MNSLIICDLDGTIIDSRSDLALAVNLTRDEFNLPKLPSKQITSYIGEGAEKLIERAFLYDSKIPTNKTLPVFKQKYSENYSVNTYVYPNVQDGLNIILEKGYKLALISNKPDEFCSKILKAYKLDAYFSIVIGGTDPKLLKPSPEVVYRALKLSKTKKPGSWIIGDHCTDLKCAKNANISACFAKYGFGNRKEELSDLDVDNFAHFAHFLSS